MRGGVPGSLPHSNFVLHKDTRDPVEGTRPHEEMSWAFDIPSLSHVSK